MVLKKLTVAEMNQISAPWVAESSPARAALEKVPHLAVLWPQVQSAHSGLLGLRMPVEDPRIRELSERQAALDAAHDDHVRAIHGVLTSLAKVLSTANELLALRDLLLPEGLTHSQQTYRGEAGHGAMVESLLDDKLQARLKAVNLHDTNLLALTQEWLRVARQIGQLEDERARLSPKPTPAADVTRARLAWIRITNALMANADLAGIDAATDAVLFAPLRAAEQAAEARGKNTTAAPVTPPAS